MIRTVSDKYGYGRVMTILSILTFIAGVVNAALGELILPFSVSLAAALFIFENPKKRILSFIIPISSVALGCILFGWQSLLSIQYVALAAVLAVCYRYCRSKAETAIYMTLLLFLFFILSIYVGGAVECGSFSPSSVGEYYRGIIATFKDKATEMLINGEYGIKVSAGFGQVLDEEGVKAYFDQVIAILPAIFAIVSFFLVGCSVKLFVFITLKVSKHGILKSFAHFIPSSLVAYIYVIISVISIFLSFDSVFSLSIINASELLMFVFSYIGAQYVIALGTMYGKKSLAMTAIIAAILIISSGAIQILSYLGAWFSISVSKPETLE